MKDGIVYVRFDVSMPQHPKIRRLSVEARWALFEMTCASKQQRLDGLLDVCFSFAYWGEDIVRELMANDSDQPSVSFASQEGYLEIHDYADYQVTGPELEALREKRQAAGRRGGIASGKIRAKQTKQTSKQVLQANRRSKTKQNEADPDPDIDIEGGLGYVTPAGAAAGADLPRNGADAPPPQTSLQGPLPCRRHPDGPDHDEPCQRCKAIREHREQATEAARIAKDEHWRVIDNCRHCSRHGTINLGTDNEPDWVPCDHDPKVVGRFYDGHRNIKERTDAH